ncbi:MAG: hypothetical protein KDA62_17960, partial [Planctomycetales bacterium]|nr:hypothetical protein [Planctomycetales bacterium]
MSDYAFDFDAQASLMGELERLVAETAQAEKAALAEQERAVQDATVKFSDSRAMLSASFDQRCESLHTEYADNREAAIYAFESDAYQLVLDHDRQMAGFEDVRDDALREADRRRKAAR